MRVGSTSRAAVVLTRSFCFATAVFFLLTACACDPPGKPEPEPTPPEKITDFHTLYAARCSGCHGPNGRQGAARILNNPLYLAVIPRDTLHDVVAHGRPGTDMPAWAMSDGGPLTDTQIDALVDGIYKNWSKPDQFRGKTLPVYSGQSFTGDAGKGRKLFARGCFPCHGPGAPVGSVTDVAYVSLVTDQMLRTSIIVGQPDYGMPDYRFLNMGHALSDQDIADVVAFISSKRPAAMVQLRGLRTNDLGTGQGGSITKGNEGSGTGPGSPRKQEGEGNKSTDGSSIRGSAK